MIALKIEDIRDFTSRLFLGVDFDRFLVREAEFSTFNTFHIDGRVRYSYYTQEELEENKMEEFSFWGLLKPVCYSLIKGKRLPGSFRIVLTAPPSAAAFVLEGSPGIRPEQVGGLYLNIRYGENRLHCITGTSLQVFTLEKSVDRSWDDYVRQLLRQKEILFTEEN